MGLFSGKSSTGFENYSSSELHEHIESTRKVRDAHPDDPNTAAGTQHTMNQMAKELERRGDL